MKIALAQLNFFVGDLDKNTEKIINYTLQAKKEGAEIVLFSELAVTGYPPLDLLSYHGIIERAWNKIKEIAEQSKDIMLVVGVPTKSKEENKKPLYNSAVVFIDGKIHRVINKTLLPSYDIFDEDRFFQPNEVFEVIEFKNKRIAITICEDLWFEKKDFYSKNPLDELVKLKPDILFNLSASPFDVNKLQDRLNIVTNNAKKYELPICYVNQVGGNTDILFDGGSIVADSKGDICAFGGFFNESLTLTDLDKIAPIKFNLPNRMSLLMDALVLGIRDYCLKSGFKKAILGLSGGIDSALVAVLAVRALGKENVRVLLMPSEYSSDHSIADAKHLAENLGIDYDIISIQSSYKELQSMLVPLFEGKEFDVAEENIQSRIRGLMLMAMSNKHGYILLNTTNKSEMAVGYGTLYGDMCGGISVIGDIYKSEVYGVSKFLNKDKEIIPVNIINKEPSAELRPDQKDTDSLPKYEVLDPILFDYIELKKSKQEIIKKHNEEAMISKIIGLVNRAEYKRYQAAPVLRVSTKAFGMGRQVPIVAKFDF